MIDASIPLQVKQPQFEPRSNALARVLQIQGMQQQQELGQMNMDAQRRDMEDQNALLRVIRGPGFNLDSAEHRSAALAANPKGAQALFKTHADTAKDKALAEKTQLEGQLKKFEIAGQIMSGVRDQATWELARQQTAQVFGAEAAAQMPAEYNPALIEQKRQQAMSVKDQLEQVWKQKGYDLDVRKVDETGRHNQATEGIQRGQLGVSQAQLGVSRERLAHEKSAPRGQFLETPNGYVLADPRGGSTAPVLGPDGKQLKGKSADKSMTDAQAKANLFGTRMKESDRILNTMEGKYSPMAVNAKMAAADAPVVGGAAGALGNWMLTAEGQQAEQAQRDFINAVLRRESGAVISPPEFENAKKQYFPQPNDDPKTLAQKRRNRALAISGMEAEVPGGFRGAPSLTGTGQTGGAAGEWSIQKVK
jgi:hypothetical protein